MTGFQWTDAFGATVALDGPRAIEAEAAELTAKTDQLFREVAMLSGEAKEQGRRELRRAAGRLNQLNRDAERWNTHVALAAREHAKALANQIRAVNKNATTLRLVVSLHDEFELVSANNPARLTGEPSPIQKRAAALAESEEARVRFFELVPMAIPGLAEIASRIEHAFPSGEASACAIGTSLVTSGAGLERWRGLRDEIVPGHPVAVTLSTAADDERYPAPCANKVQALSTVAGFRKEGRVCSIDGVAVPAGPSQMVSLVYARWHTLFHPRAKAHQIYCGDLIYDRIMSTDHIQRELWGFGVYEFVGYLESILSKSHELFVAIWLRRWDDIERLPAQAEPSNKTSLYEFFDNPELLSLNSGNRNSFLAPWAIMSEIERIVEIAKQMKARRGISSAAVRAKVASYNSVDELMADQSEIGKHIQGLLLSLRFVHNTMNGPSQPYADTDLLARLKQSVECSDALGKSYRRVECPNGAAPALLMNGLDLAHFIPASIYQLGLGLLDQIEDRNRSHGIIINALKRNRRGIWLSIIILADICPPTAQALTAKLNRAEPTYRPEGQPVDYIKVNRNERGWLTIYTTAMALGSKAFSADRPDSEALISFVENNFTRYAQRIDEIVTMLPTSFRSLAIKISRRALESVSRVGKPGWTRGAYHQAWLEPDAEVEFLEKCSNFILFDEELEREAKTLLSDKGDNPQSRIENALSHSKGRLPLIHPLEHVQQIFRRQFDCLQIPSVLPDELTKQRSFRKFAILQETAKLLPAWSPINSDPGLAERITAIPVGRRTSSVRGNLDFDEIKLMVSGSWQMDWSSCGRI